MTPQQMAGEAARILREVREAHWPDTREARWAIGWAYADASDAGEDYARLLSGETDPCEVRVEGAGWLGKTEALEHLADAYLQAARAARKRLAEHKRRQDAGVLITARQMTGGLI